MRTELCQFSGFKIYPGHGRRYCRIDGKAFNFINARCEAHFLAKKNPRKLRWTVLYRRKNKKGIQEDVVKKRSRKTVKYQRGIQGTTWGEILAKRNQKPEVRKAMREQAIKLAKEKKKTTDPSKKGQKEKAAAPKAAPKVKAKTKAAKQVKKAAPRVGGKR